ncbi:MAG: hypothetical protein WA712_12875, partial [Pseudolabrys sp.]
MAAQLVAYHRPAWCAIQWRAWLGETRRAGRGFVAGRPCFDPLKRRDGCREYCDCHRNSEKYDGGTVAIPLVRHEEASTTPQNAMRLGWFHPPPPASAKIRYWVSLV